LSVGERSSERNDNRTVAAIDEDELDPHRRPAPNDPRRLDAETERLGWRSKSLRLRAARDISTAAGRARQEKKTDQ